MSKENFFTKHAELWKFIKFSFAGMSSTIIELIIYYILQNIVFKNLNSEPFDFLIFHYDGLGYLLSFLISTTIGYAIAFVMNRKVTFHSDANKTLSIILYIIMVIFTIFMTTWLGMLILEFCISRGKQALGETIAKPIVAILATAWTYPINRFVIHRNKKN